MNWRENLPPHPLHVINFGYSTTQFIFRPYATLIEQDGDMIMNAYRWINVRQSETESFDVLYQRSYREAQQMLKKHISRKPIFWNEGHARYPLANLLVYVI
jgi:hypothetical protein